jgi:hypothetical protein
MGSFRTELATSLDPPDSIILPANSPPPASLDLKARYHSEHCGATFFDALAIGPRVIFLLTAIAGRLPEAHAIAARSTKFFPNQSAAAVRAARGH